MHAKTLLLLASLSFATSPLAACQPDPVSPAANPVSANPVQADGVQPEFANADELLDALETADADLSVFTAQIAYTKIAHFLGDRELRMGKMQFVSQPREGKPPKRMFGVRFDKLFIGNIADDEPKVFIFDGHWFVEKLPNEKIIIKREVVRPGEEADPLRIGEGPFPIPIGQKKADILGRFDAELVAEGDGLTLDPDMEHDDEEVREAKNLTLFTRDCVQLRLTPRTEFADGLDFTEIRLWYKRTGDGPLLPRMARTLDIDENISVIQLIGAKMNTDATTDDTLLNTDVPDGWNAQIRPWDGG